MKSFSRAGLRMASAVLCAVAFSVVVAPFRAQADEWNKKTVLTVNQPIQVSKTVLQPGEYVLKLLALRSDRHVGADFYRDELISSTPCWLYRIIDYDRETAGSRFGKHLPDTPKRCGPGSILETIYGRSLPTPKT